TVACFSASDHSGDSSRLLAGILVLKWAESFVRLGVLGALTASVLLLGLPWKRDVIGIAAGFAFYGCIELTMLAARVNIGRHANRYVSWAFMFSGLVEKIIWAGYFLVRVTPKRVPTQVCDSDAAASLR